MPARDTAPCPTTLATIALRLKGVVAPYEVGRRFIDASEPGRPMTSLPDGASGDKQVLRCALYSPTPPPPERVAAETAEWPAGKTQELRQQLKSLEDELAKP